MVGYMIETCQKADYRLTSVNPIVCECNDAGLNDIQDRALGRSICAAPSPTPAPTLPRATSAAAKARSATL